MSHRDIVAIGTSAGGFEALLFLAKGFAKDFPASILITIHLPSEFRSSLDELLTRAGPLRATFANEGEIIERSRIYIAPPGRHLLVNGEQLSLGVGPRENGARPAIDVMMRSVAVCCGSRTIGAVLTGMLADGASGLWAIGRTGGTTLVQDPGDAAFPEMPQTALQRTEPDHVVNLRDMPGLLDALVHQPAGTPVTPPDKLRYEVEIAKSGRASMKGMDWFGVRSALTCPDCGGVMWQLKDGPLSRYRCHIGHAYGEEQMVVGLDDNLRRAMASALRALNERVALVGKLRDLANEVSQPRLAESWSMRAQEFEREAEVISEAIRRLEQPGRTDK
jgi:two-component system, chemotaxis family, protein-glutamate methylesterase/glutaminase